ncbi:hypothetical protein [Pseudonocardia sp.]|nr:hypothetical protein [Pseudonocardia sp.]MCW2716763.1 hypothetical protein [Pseudonocardia sp.]MDT7612857.1 hypothetical protein [Pseudonocardiales bacterium]
MPRSAERAADPERTLSVVRPTPTTLRFALTRNAGSLVVSGCIAGV